MFIFTPKSQVKCCFLRKVLWSRGRKRAPYKKYFFLSIISMNRRIIDLVAIVSIEGSSNFHDFWIWFWFMFDENAHFNTHAPKRINILLASCGSQFLSNLNLTYKSGECICWMTLIYFIRVGPISQPFQMKIILKNKQNNLSHLSISLRLWEISRLTHNQLSSPIDKCTWE